MMFWEKEREQEWEENEMQMQSGKWAGKCDDMKTSTTATTTTIIDNYNIKYLK